MKLTPLLNADFGAGTVPVPGTSVRRGRLHTDGGGDGHVERLSLDMDRGVIIAESKGKRRFYPLTAAVGGVEPLAEMAAPRAQPEVAKA